jgi:fumarate reductase subunit D
MNKVKGGRWFKIILRVSMLLVCLTITIGSIIDIDNLRLLTYSSLVSCLVALIAVEFTYMQYEKSIEDTNWNEIMKKLDEISSLLKRK